MNKRYKYSPSKIIADWRKYKGKRGYAAALSKKHGVPVCVIHNTIFQYRAKQRETSRAYRQPYQNSSVTATKAAKVVQKPSQKVKVRLNANLMLQNSVVLAGASFNYGYTIC